MAKTVKKLTVDLQTGSDRLLYAVWSVPSTLKNIDHYNVSWRYGTGDGHWFYGQEPTATNPKQSTFSAPSNATQVKCGVKPVSKKKSSGSSYWTGAYTYVTYTFKAAPPAQPSAPTVEIKDYTLTAKLDNISDSNTYSVQFQVVQDDNSIFSTGTSTVKTSSASYSCTVTAGHEYKVRARGINTYNGTEYGDWSDYSSNIGTIPTTPTGVKCEADSMTSAHVSYKEVSNADSYTIEYAVNKYYFDSSSEVQSVSDIKSTDAYVTGLDSGQEWFFRVKAVNDYGESGWSSIVSTVLGTAPAAPTTWSSTTTAMVGETVTLYWVHNSEDGSKSRGADLEVTINGRTTHYTIAAPTYSSDDTEKTYSYDLDLSGYGEGATILWRVRTMGVTQEYGDYSEQRQIDVYASPTLMLTYIEHITSFPFDIKATAGPSSQTPISYNIVVVANESYESTNEYGGREFINAGDVVFSKTYYTSENPYTITLSADNITLDNGEDYTVTVTVAMDSGLTAETSYQFDVEWDMNDYDIDASIGIDQDALVAYINPSCMDIDDEAETETLSTGVTLAVYRREFDGTFTEIASGLENDGYITVTDPHPALDYARYRIVVRDISTGVIYYEDLPGEYVGVPYAVFQWDEDWTDFDFNGDEDGEPVEPAWSGSLVKIPYNLDTTEEHSPDVEDVEYIGRSHPVAYYGTQTGESANWSCVIDKLDKDTLYALRRLARYQGNVYVREPSGVGYWAHVELSISDTHAEVIRDISAKITRVEGGM